MKEPQGKKEYYAKSNPLILNKDHLAEVGHRGRCPRRSGGGRRARRERGRQQTCPLKASAPTIWRRLPGLEEPRVLVRRSSPYSFRDPWELFDVA